MQTGNVDGCSDEKDIKSRLIILAKPDNIFLVVDCDGRDYGDVIFVIKMI